MSEPLTALELDDVVDYICENIAKNPGHWDHIGDRFGFENNGARTEIGFGIVKHMGAYISYRRMTICLYLEHEDNFNRLSEAYKIGIENWFGKAEVVSDNLRLTMKRIKRNSK